MGYYGHDDDGDPREYQAEEDIKLFEFDHLKRKNNQPLSKDKDSCSKCKGKIAMTDVEGHYRGECNYCRGAEYN
jgi:hypothetical protein|tara:strand:+ start:757 stop:978 length:222 start_codon:yes stop_codon:yes gene_type:complete